MQPTWTGKYNPQTERVEWVLVGTPAAVSSPTPQRDASHFRSVGINTGARPKQGEKCFKPSESLLHDLTRAQDEKTKAKRDKLREDFIQIERDFDSGKRRMDEDVRMGTPVVAVPNGQGGVRYVREDRVPEQDRLRIEREREEARIAALPPEPVAAAPEQPAFDGNVAVFEGGAADHANTIAATGPVPTLSQDWLSWPAQTRNDSKRML